VAILLSQIDNRKRLLELRGTISMWKILFILSGMMAFDSSMGSGSDHLVFADEKGSMAMSRDEFLRVVAIGMPRADVLQAIGKPAGRSPSKQKGFSEIRYDDLIKRSDQDQTEAVTIIILDLYDVVSDIRWADGTTVRRFATRSGYPAAR